MPISSIACARTALIGWIFLCASAAQTVETYVWVDEHGVTHLTDDVQTVPGAKRLGASGDDLESLRALWDDGILGATSTTPPGFSSSESDRVLRLLRGAAIDLRRGDDGAVRSDLYATATIAYQALTKKHPFLDEDDPALRR